MSTPSGSAELLFGTSQPTPNANQEIGDPGASGHAELPFGTSQPTPNANQEIGDPGASGRTELPFGTSANQVIGDPGDPGLESKPFWHSRGYLPHYENPVAIQHVTFHLADSLPKSALERMETELQIFPFKRQEEERRKRIEALRDAGHGSCVLRNPEIAQMVQDALFYFDGQRYRLIAWVIMPNHLHMLFQPLHNWTVAKIVASWKKFTARKILEYQRFIHCQFLVCEKKGKAFILESAGL